jgi:hypothetical protein
VNGAEYELSGPDQIVVNGPIVSARPMYVQVSTTSTTTATAPTTSMTTTSSTVSARASHQAPQTTTAETVEERAPADTTTSEGEFVWLVKVSGNAFFWIFMMVVVVAIVIMTRQR